MAWEDVLHFYVLRAGPELMSIIQCIDDADWMRISAEAETGWTDVGGVIRIEGTKQEIFQQLESCNRDWAEYLRYLD